MAITDGLIVRVQPVAGDTAIKNLVDNSTFTGTGTPTLVDEGAEKAWQISDGISLSVAVNAVMNNVTGGGKTIVMRAKFTNFGSLSDQVFAGLRTNSGVSVQSSEGPRFYRSAATSRVYARSGTLMNTGSTTVTWLNTIVTIVYTPKITAADSNDVGHQWWSRTDRVGDAADATSSTSTWVSRTFTDFFISAASGAQFNLLDFLVYDRQITDAEASALATGTNGLRAQIPAPSGGTTPTGTVTIGTITPNSTGASVPFSYSAADQTGFEYRLNGGTAVTGTNSPQVLTGLTPSTAYTIEIRAINASGAGAWSAVANFTTSAASSPPAGTFTIGTITTTQTTASVPYTYSAADFDSIEYRIDGGTPVAASASPQSLTGLTAGTTYGIEFRAVNAFGNGAWSTSAPFTTASVPVVTFTTGVLRKMVGGGTLANTAMVYFRLYNPATGELVLNRTDLSTDANGRVVCPSATLTAGVEYKADWLAVTGETRMSKKAAT